MIDIQNIEDNYKSMSVDELLNLSKKPQDLRLEVIPILQKELINRKKNQEALALTDFLIKSRENEKPRYKDLSSVELRKLIDTRLDSGQSLESIKIDLKDEGINVFDIINEDEKLRDKAFDYITQLKQQGLEDKEIDQKLKENLSLDKADSEMLKVQLKKKGRQNLIFGYSLTIIAAILIMVSISLGGNVTISAIVIVCIGIWRIITGYDQIKD